MAQVVQYEKRARKLRESVEQLSLRRDVIRTHLESELGGIVAGFVSDYEHFRMWEAKHRATWLKNPASYDADLDAGVDRVYGLWFSAAQRLAQLLDMAEREDCSIPKSAEFRRHYETMLSIEVMDHGPMPEHMLDITRAAAIDTDAEAAAE